MRSDRAAAIKTSAAVPQKLKLTTRPDSSARRRIPKRTVNTCSHKNVYIGVPDGVTLNKQKGETSINQNQSKRGNIHQLMDKRNAASACEEIVFQS